MNASLLKLCLLAGIVLVGPVSAVTLTVSPVAQNAVRGQTISVAIQASGLPQGEVVTAYDLMLGYDATRLTATGGVFGSALGGNDPNIGAIDGFYLTFDPRSLEGAPNYGTYLGAYGTAVEFFEISLVSDYYADLHPLQPPEPFALLTVTFQVNPGAAAGLTTLQLMDDRFYSAPPAGGAFDVKGADDSNILTATLYNGSVTVADSPAAIPVPATPLLMLLAAALGLGRRPRAATLGD